MQGETVRPDIVPNFGSLKETTAPLTERETLREIHKTESGFCFFFSGLVGRGVCGWQRRPLFQHLRMKEGKNWTFDASRKSNVTNFHKSLAEEQVKNLIRAKAVDIYALTPGHSQQQRRGRNPPLLV